MKIQNFFNNKVGRQLINKKNILLNSSIGDVYTFTGATMKENIKRVNEMEESVQKFNPDLNFKYPFDFIKIADAKEKEFGKWTIFFDKSFVNYHLNGLKNRYGITDLIPFASLEDSTNLSCFYKNNDEWSVILISPFFPKEPRILARFDNFNDWKERVEENDD